MLVHKKIFNKELIDNFTKQNTNDTINQSENEMQ